MKAEPLNDLMQIKINGPKELDEQDIAELIDNWI